MLTLLDSGSKYNTDPGKYTSVRMRSTNTHLLFQLLTFYNNAVRRLILAEILPNHMPRSELSESHRSVSYLVAISPDNSAPEITEVEYVPVSTIKTTIQRIHMTRSVSSAPQTGRPKKDTPRQVRPILRNVQKYPKWTYQKGTDQTSPTLELTTVKALLTKHCITNWRCKTCPHLTQGHANIRLQQALNHRNTDWSNVVLFSQVLN